MPRLHAHQIPDGGAAMPPFLRRALPLVDAGYNVFPLRKGAKVPLPGTQGFKDATTDEKQIRAWAARHPDANAGIATGHGLIVVDIDVHDRDGNPAPGEDNWAGLISGLDVPPAVVVRTPSGGRHLLYRGTPVQTNAGIVAPHVDIRSSGGYIVAPGSLVDGKAYEVVGAGALPTVLDLPEATTDLVSVVTSRGGQKRATAQGTTAPRRNNSLADLLADPPTEGGRNDWLARVAGHHARAFRGNRPEYDAAIAEANVLLDSPLPAWERDRTAESIWAGDLQRHQDEQAASPSESGKGGKGDKPSAYRQCLDFLERTYDLYRSQDEEPFAIPKQGVRRPIMLSEKGEGGLRGDAQYLYERHTGQPVNNTAMTQALASLYIVAKREAPMLRLDLRAARPRPDMVVIDLGQADNTNCAVITPGAWHVAPEPPEGVAFRTTSGTRPLPSPQAGDGGRALRALVGWPADDPRWRLARGWVATAGLADIPRPVLFFHGRAGSSKTTKAITLVSILDPRDELGSSFGKNEKDEAAMASNRYIVGFDNVSRASEETSDRLCRLVTGTSDERRSLYSNNELIVFSYRRTGVITGLSVPTFKPDALERLVQLQCDTIPDTARRSEKAIRDDFARDHPVMLGAVLDDLAEILRNLPASVGREGGKPRMADFADALHALDPEIEKAFVDATANAMTDAAESDPFVLTLTRWLSTETLPLRLSASDAHKQAERHRDPQDLEQHVWWPKDGRAFAGALVRQAGPLESVGLRVSSSRTGQSRAWLFEQVGPDRTLPTAPLSGLERESW